MMGKPKIAPPRTTDPPNVVAKRYHESIGERCAASAAVPCWAAAQAELLRSLTVALDGSEGTANRRPRKGLAHDPLEQGAKNGNSACQRQLGGELCSGRSLSTERVGFIEVEGDQSDGGTQNRGGFDLGRTVVKDERQRAEAIAPADVLTSARVVWRRVERLNDAGVPADDLGRDAERSPDPFRISGYLDGFRERPHV